MHAQPSRQCFFMVNFMLHVLWLVSCYVPASRLCCASIAATYVALALSCTINNAHGNLLCSVLCCIDTVQSELQSEIWSFSVIQRNLLVNYIHLCWRSFPFSIKYLVFYSLPVLVKQKVDSLGQRRPCHVKNVALALHIV